MQRPKTAIDKVSDRLDDHKFVIIPTIQVGSLRCAENADGIRPDAIELTITDINEMVYADKIQITLGEEE